jgi:hypothetical protein
MIRRAKMETGTTCLSGGDFIKNWNQWKKTVSEAIKMAKKLGMPDKMIEIASVKVGDFLTTRLCTESPEEGLIKELWEVATPEERKVMGKLLLKIMEKA